jgi:hypothetical protein
MRNGKGLECCNGRWNEFLELLFFLAVDVTRSTHLVT